MVSHHLLISIIIRKINFINSLDLWDELRTGLVLTTDNVLLFVERKTENFVLRVNMNHLKVNTFKLLWLKLK